MASNGLLEFQGTNKATFVGANSNIVLDTVTSSLGIGVDVDGPTSNLHVVGNAYVSTELTVGGTVTAAGFTGNASTATKLAASVNIGGVAFDGSGAIVPITFNGATFNGNVGIGTTTPTAKLHIKSSSGADGIAIFNDAGGTGGTLALSSGVRGGLLISNSGGGSDGTDDYSSQPIVLSGGGTAATDGNLRGGSIWSKWGGSQYGLGFKGASNGDAVPEGASAPTLFVTADKVSIGTTIPQTSLQIKDETDTSGTGDAFITGLSGNTSNRKPTECLRLQGKFHASGSGALLRFTNQHDSGTNPNTDEYNVAGIAGFDYASQWGGGLCFYTTPNTSNGGDLIPRMVIDSSGFVGFGTNAPLSRMHHKQTADQGGEATLGSYQNGLILERSGTTDKWTIASDAYNSLCFFVNTARKGYFLSGGADGRVNFTGQHRTFIKDIPFTRAEELEGLIVSADNNKYIKMNGGVEAGSNAITVNESLPIVSLSTKVKDKKCFGVISASEDPSKRQEQHGNFISDFEKELGDTRVYINSVGEGAIWVTNINGPLESGDYITTSNVAGYGQKQDSEFLANYTVAKITMDCDFSPVTQPIQNIKKDETGENTLDEHGQIQWEDHPTETEKAYKVRYLDVNGVITDEANAVHTAAFVGCTYHCG